MVKRALEFSNTLGDEMKIDEGGFYRRMSKQTFNGVKIGSLVQKVGCETVTEGVNTSAAD